MTNEKKEKLALTVPEAAELLGICPKLCYEMCHRAGFPAFRVGRKLVVSADGLRDWVRRQEVSAV